MGELGPRPLPTFLFFGLAPIGAWFIIRPLLEPIPPLPALYSSLGFSIYAFLATLYLVPTLGPAFIKAGLHGKDLLKTYDTPMCGSLSTFVDYYPKHARTVPRALGLHAPLYTS